MSRQAKRFKSLVVAVIAIIATNAAISYGFSNRGTLPIVPEPPKPRTGMPSVVETQPRGTLPITPDVPRP